MQKKLFLSIFAVAFALLAFSNAAMAKQNIPQVDGTYDVPGNPDMKVRVFVHKAKPYFGNTSNALPACSDTGSTAIVKAAGWKLPAGTWNYYVNSASAPTSIGDLNLNSLTSASFAEWQSKTDFRNLRNFSYAGDTSISKYAQDGQNILAWGSAPSGALAVTYTWYNRKTKMAVETDTIMNKKFLWSWTPYSLGICGASGSYDAQDILTHELGHWVGLNDHYTSAYANNTMYGYGAKGEIKKDTLTQGDIEGVDKIY